MAGWSGSVAGVLDRLPPLEGNEAAAPMLPKECYVDPGFYEFERQAVFARSWVAVGRVEQLPEPGDFLAPTVAGERVLVVRGEAGELTALSAVCQHRGQILACEGGRARRFTCPLHAWTYDLSGRLIGAPRMGGPEELRRLRAEVRLPRLSLEVWHGFIFVNLDTGAAPLAPSLAKLEPFWENYGELVPVPPTLSDNPLPWNWKTQLENFTDAYHTEFVHTGTHDFAPSVTEEEGEVVAFTQMAAGDNAIVRSVPLLRSDGGMMSDGWGPEAEFPPVATLAPAQRMRLTFAMVPPSLTLVFAPSTVAYTFVAPAGPEGTLAANDRVTAGGWLLPRSTLDRPDFAERAQRVREGARKIWAQDLPVNLAMQAGKRSIFSPENIYGPLEVTLVQFNAWLLRRYREGAVALGLAERRT